MIVPMSKYSFLIYHKDRLTFMQKLMDLGILHVILKTEEEDESTLKLSSMVIQAEEVQKSFAKRDKARKKEETATLKSLDYPKPQLKEVPELETRYKELLSEKIALLAHIKMIKPWGIFDWTSVSKMENATGVSMRFCRHPKRKFNQDWLKKYPIEIINEENGFLYFIIFQEEDNSELPVVPLALPKKSLSELNERLDTCENEIFTIDQKLGYYSLTYSKELEDALRIAKDELFLQSSILNLETLHDEKVVLVEGWCPKTLKEDLHSFIEKDNIVYTQHKSTIDDKPPVLLKNNKFTKLFEPIGNLFSLPAYSELDLTIFFAPFFVLFFGFCLGDLGYGVVYLIIGTLLKLKIKGKMRNLLTLLQIFGVSTIIIGFISGTLFGLTMADLPYFANVKNLFLDQNQLLKLALAVGFIQIIFGMGVNVYKHVIFTGWLSALSKVGWIILLFSLLDILVTKSFLQISGITVWIGVGLIVFFGSPKDGWLKSFGYGLVDLYSITGVAGDLLSYIRLFALGVSSAILGLVVNSLALSAKGVPYIGFVLFVLTLIIGHGANLMLSSLSAFVHPMRLTFVEFYKNTGFLGGGKPYKPLAKEGTSEE